MTTFIQTSKFQDSAVKLALKVARSVSQLKELHSHMTKVGVEQQEQLLDRILQFPNHLDYAAQLFHETSTMNQFLWTVMIRVYTQKNLFLDAFFLFQSMHRRGVSPNEFTYSSVIHSCAHLPSVREGKETHCHIIKCFPKPGAIVETALLNMYSRFCVSDDARMIFDEMSDRDIVSWTAMLDGYAKVGLMDEAQKLFDEMPERNVVSWTAIVGGYADAGNMEVAHMLFDKMPQRDVTTWSKMIAGYGKVGDIEAARQLFDTVPQHDVATWSSMISCYTQNGLAKEAIDLFERMKTSSVKPNEITMVSVISAASQLSDAEVSSRILECIESWKLEMTVFLANSLIHMHAKCGNIQLACRVFDKMSVTDVISYSAMINALADHGHTEYALNLFSRMQREGIKPNGITFVGVLNACSHAGLVDQGCEYFESMKNEYNITPLKEHYACMVDLFSRAGRLEEAYDVIKGMTEKPDAAVWGALLGGCRVYLNAELGEIAARHLFELEPHNTGNYLLLSNIYASCNKRADAEKLRIEMDHKGIIKSPGCSWV